MNKTSETRVVVGMSGGVDSSVAAALLKQHGYRVTGVTMKLWDGPALSRTGKRHGCYGPGEAEDIGDAKDVARSLGISIHVIDVSAEYRTEVLDYFRDEYRSGRTPNPCSRCNPRIKFGALVQKVRESGIEFDYFATGHYAKVEKAGDSGRYLLRKARDLNKDQSYFLGLLSKAQIACSLFPLGNYVKSEVRTLAKELALPVSEKPDSQDFVDSDCEAVAETPAPGPILDVQGREIGRHRGISNHTIGQRKGLGISSARPLYVTGIDPARNAVIVGERSQVFSSELVASNLNWISIDNLEAPIEVQAKIRARHDAARASVNPRYDGTAYVKFEQPQMAITPGQTIVFYQGDVVIGGGVIDRTKE